MSVNQAVERIRGAEGTVVVLTVKIGPDGPVQSEIAMLGRSSSFPMSLGEDWIQALATLPSRTFQNKPVD